MAENSMTNTVNKRNYLLDFYKLVFSVFVVWSHSGLFKNGDATVFIPSYIGWWSVYFFFVVSGFLMVRSLSVKKYDVDNAGSSALSFVLTKFKGFATEYWVALGLFVVVFMLGRPLTFQTVSNTLITCIPEIFGVTTSGLYLEWNAPTWYISAMLITMLPLSYMFIRNRDFSVYVFAPVAALILYGFMYQLESPDNIDKQHMFGIFTGALVRALCGLCFGAISYIIYEKLSNLKPTKKQRLWFTALDILLIVIVIGTQLFNSTNINALFSAYLLVPVLVALTFSGFSYLAEFFRFKWMKVFSSISLAVYFNHWAARRYVSTNFKGDPYNENLYRMIVLTLSLCVIYYIVLAVIRYVKGNKKAVTKH